MTTTNTTSLDYRMDENYQKTLIDVCSIFRDVTGGESIPQREAGAVIPFIREFGWTNYDFRLLIEWQWADPTNKEFLLKPGRLNLRSIFNPARKDFLIDVLADLKRAKQIQEKQKLTESSTPDLKVTHMRCKCGDVLDLKYIKIPCEVNDRTPKGYYWESAYADDLEVHYKTCPGKLK